MLRLYHKHNIRDKIHILVSYLNSLWCLDGINEKSMNTQLYIIQCILKSLQGMYGYTKRYLKDNIIILKSNIGLQQNGLDWKTIKNIRLRLPRYHVEL